MTIKNWSTTPSTNATADAANGVNFAENQSAASLNDSIRALMAEIKKSVAGDVDAGLIALASVAETLAGTDATQALTPAGFAGSKSLTNPGYYKFPGGLTVQWGQTDILLDGNGDKAVTFPVAFGSTVYGVWVNSANVTTSGSAVCGPRSPSEVLPNQFVVSFRPNPGAVTRRISYLAIGI